MDRAGGQRPADRQPPGGGQVARGDGPILRVAAGGIEVRVRPVPGEKSEVVVRPVDGGLAAAQDDVLRSARRLLLDADLAKQLQLTDEQRKNLRQVQFAPGLTISDNDRTNLVTLALAWEQAAGPAKAAAESKLVAAMKDVAARSVDPAKKAVQQSIQQVKGILTPQQLQALQQADAKPPSNAKPATQPVV